MIDKNKNIDIWVAKITNNNTKKVRVRLFKTYTNAWRYSTTYIKYAYKLTYKYYDYSASQEIETETIPDVADFETILKSQGHTYEIYKGAFYEDME